MSVALLSPHNDDEALFASFFILRYKPDVFICYQSKKQGEGTHKVRNKESSFGLKMLGVNYYDIWDYWDTDNSDVTNTALYNSIYKVTEEYETIIAPAFCERGHEQHNRVHHYASICAEALGKDLILYTTYGQDGRQTGDQLNPEPDWISRKHNVLACYKSQIAEPSTREHFMRDIREYYG